MKKRAVCAVLAAALLCAAGLLCGISLRRAFGSGEVPVPVYSVEGLRLAEWTESISVPVTVSAGSSRIFYADSARPVSEFYVEAGDGVEAGQPLFQYDPSELEQELSGIELTLENERIYLERLGDHIGELKRIGAVLPVEGKEVRTGAVGGGLIHIVGEVPGEGASAEESGAETAPETGAFVIYEEIGTGSAPQRGDGSEEDPYVYYLKKGGMVSAEVLAKLIRLEKRARIHVAGEDGEILFTWEFDGKVYEEQTGGEQLRAGGEFLSGREQLRAGGESLPGREQLCTGGKYGFAGGERGT